ALSGYAATLVNRFTARAPNEQIARDISLMLASMSLSGNAAMNVGNACGYFPQISAKQSLAMRASSAATAGGPIASNGGLASESTCRRPAKLSTSRQRDSTSTSVSRRGQPVY